MDTDHHADDAPAAAQVKTFRRILGLRRSIRQFLPHPVPRHIQLSVLEDAQQTPSNCNTQPWMVHILSGASRDAFSRAISADWDSGTLSPDFGFDTSAYPAHYGDRARAQGAAYYQALGIDRADYDERRVAGARNLSFFGAPHVALLFMPSVGDNVRIAADIGMYAQTFLLSLAAHGLGGVPQTMLGFFAGPARKICGTAASDKLMFGISFGYADRDHLAGKYNIGRVPTENSTVFHD